METKNKQLLTGITLALMTLMLMSITTAFGVAGYGDEPIKVKPGESIDLAFRVQNMVGTDDYKLMVDLRNEPQINVTLLDPSLTYELKHGTIVRVNFRVNVPKEAEIGKKYNINADFTTAPLEEGKGALGIQSVITDHVIIQVAGETEDSTKRTPTEQKTIKETNNKNYNKIIVLIILIIIVTTAIIYIKKRRNSST